MSKRPTYGFPCVSDPRDFIPDAESCSQEELQTHRQAVANYGKPTFEPNKGCYTEYDDSDQLARHVLRTSWGIGTNLVPHCDGCNMPTFNDPLVMCHECGEQEFCEACWLKHEKEHEES